MTDVDLSDDILAWRMREASVDALEELLTNEAAVQAATRAYYDARYVPNATNYDVQPPGIIDPMVAALRAVARQVAPQIRRALEATLDEVTIRRARLTAPRESAWKSQARAAFDRALKGET